MSKSEHGLSTDGFVAFPIHSLVAVFHSVDALDKAVSELKNSGFVRDEMRSFVGEEAMLEMDFDGPRTGRWPSFCALTAHRPRPHLS